MLLLFVTIQHLYHYVYMENSYQSVAHNILNETIM